MGRSRKCNWKRKQLKANKKKGPVMLTGAEYFKLNALGQTKSPSSIVLKNRRGDYVIGYSSNNEAKKAYDTIKKALQDNRIIELNYSSEPHKLRGGRPDYYPAIRTADGRYIDPELGDIRPEDYKKLWPEVVPKMNSKKIGVPIIFGTAGHDANPHWAHDIWEKEIKNNAKYFIAAHDYEEAVGDFPTLPKDFFEYDPNGRNK